MKPGSPEKYDYEYIRNGTANIFVAVEFKAGKRVTQVTKRRTMKDFALFVKMLVDEYPDVEVIRLVTDNLNTHKEKAFYETFSKEEAERILGKIEFQYTPKHASWLNAAEIEISYDGYRMYGQADWRHGDTDPGSGCMDQEKE
ncbi:hypothetical protein C5S32_03795 [ANME-1 cluster archaeon GoMg1]|nr:hypothetical protein [ANME-1 cluster archaeon GoMg1]